jgi:hypothetical protein
LWAYAVGILLTCTLLLWCFAFLLRSRDLLVAGMVAMCTTLVFIEAGFVIQAIRRSKPVLAALAVVATLVVIVWVAFRTGPASLASNSAEPAFRLTAALVVLDRSFAEQGIKGIGAQLGVRGQDGQHAHAFELAKAEASVPAPSLAWSQQATNLAKDINPLRGRRTILRVLAGGWRS